MTVFPGLGQLNWAAYHRENALEHFKRGDRHQAHMEIEKAFGSVWWIRQRREDYQARIEFRDELIGEQI